MIEIQAIRDLFDQLEPSKKRDVKIFSLITVISTISVALLANRMSDEYFNKGEVSNLGLKCFTLISIGMAESLLKLELMKNSKKYPPDFDTLSTKLPGGALVAACLVTLLTVRAHHASEGSCCECGDRYSKHPQAH